MENEPTATNGKLKKLTLWFVASAFTLAAGYWLNEYQRETPGLYGLSDTKSASQIVSAGVSDLEVRYKNSPVKGNVIVQQIKIWNRGKKAIEPGDILPPLGLKISPPVTLLDFQVQYQSRRFIEFSAGTPAWNAGNVPIDPPHIALDWKLLEQDDGVTIQLIYEGPKQVEFSFTGGIKGQKKIPFVNKSDPKLPFGATLPKETPFLLVAAFVVLSTLMTLLDHEGKQGRVRKVVFLGTLIFVSVVGVASISAAMYQLFQQISTTPPF